MPRFDDRILDCSIYMYPTEKDAKAGSRAGGSGFLAVVDGIVAGAKMNTTVPEAEHGQLHFHVYAVSNRHVVKENPIIRLNRHDGQSDVIPFGLDDWLWNEDTDVAVVPISFNAECKYLFVSVSSSFVTKEIMAHYDIGIGDEVFMVGRLVHHGGTQRNNPTLRFGHISAMPFEPIFHYTNRRNEQKGFLVEVHSVSGYSGSPVFVRPFPVDKFHVSRPESFDTAEAAIRHFQGIPGGPWLLGVEWGYINNHDQRQNNTGISGVVPAWHVIDLLNTEKLKMQRAEEEKNRKERRTAGGTTLTS